MKARIHYFRTAKEKKLIEEEMLLEYRKIERKKAREMAQRCLKIFLFVLNRDHHFGEKRAKEFYRACGELLETADSNPVFWEQIDRVVIDYLGITEFDRDYTEHGKAVRYDDDKGSGEQADGNNA